MGSGIAQVAALAGLSVVMADVSKEFVDRGLSAMETSLAKAVEKGKLDAAAAASARARVRTTLELEQMRECEFIVEAVTENFELKRKTFAQLNRAISPHAVLASNTSSISITELAAASGRLDRFIGMH